jgi:itaconate CoA-transferase
MVSENEYKAKLTDSRSAVQQIGSHSVVAIGQAVCQPPALMEALASRAEAGNIDDVKLYYMHAEEHMKRSLLRYELMGRIKPYSMLLTLNPRPIHEHERKIGQRIAELIPDRACLQVGVGGVPSGVCEALIDRKDLGIHTEVLNPALAHLIQKGIVTNRWKKINPGKSVFTFAMGDEAFYEFLNDNITLESHPVNYVNDPAVIAQNDNVVSINSTIEMDLTGACNSEFVKGHQFTSTGGQLDFVRGAYASKGGMSFIAFQSSIKDGKISKIVPRLSGPVTTPRTDVHYVVTENGVANLKGLSSAERAQALIGLADPAFQDELTAAAKSMHLI